MTHEMEAVIQTLEEMGVSAVMSRATKEKLKWCNGFKMKEHFGGEMPKTLEDVLDIIGGI